VSEWFDEYLANEPVSSDTAEPVLHKAMVVLLSRTFDYSLKTEDLLDLNNGNRQRALLTVVGLLEEGETVATKLTKRQAPGVGKTGQWEREVRGRSLIQPTPAAALTAPRRRSYSSATKSQWSCSSRGCFGDSLTRQLTSAPTARGS
jgi:hypothetical protein